MHELQVLQMKATNVTAAMADAAPQKLTSAASNGRAAGTGQRTPRGNLGAPRNGRQVVLAPLSGGTVAVANVDSLPQELFQVDQIDLRGSSRLKVQCWTLPDRPIFTSWIWPERRSPTSADAFARAGEPECSDFGHADYRRWLERTR